MRMFKNKAQIARKRLCGSRSWCACMHIIFCAPPKWKSWICSCTYVNWVSTNTVQKLCVIRMDIIVQKHACINNWGAKDVYRSRRVLTIRNVAARVTAFILTSRSMGKETPKLSASVNASLMNPVHCLEILPTFDPPSADMTWGQWE